MQFDKFLGFDAVGDTIVFRPLHGETIDVFHCPPDVDPHIVAQALNDSANGILRFLSIQSNFKF